MSPFRKALLLSIAVFIAAPLAAADEKGLQIALEADRRDNGWIDFQADMVMIPARPQKHGLIAIALLNVESQHPVVKLQRPIQIGNLQVNMPDHRFCGQ